MCGLRKTMHTHTHADRSKQGRWLAERLSKTDKPPARRKSESARSSRIKTKVLFRPKA